MHALVSRKIAKAQGLVRYFTGNPCSRGHRAERFVSTASCVECANSHSREWKKSHRTSESATKRKWAKRNREKVRALKRSYYESDPKTRERQALRSRKWMEENRQKYRASSAKWRKANLDAAAAAQQRRRAKLLKRVPSWADHDKIRQIYVLARDLTVRTGMEHEVDHIVPLQGEMVSGLHVETNLQILPRRENRAKGARLLELTA